MATPLIPPADVLPVHWGWFQALLLVTFPLHLLAMNAMLGGLLIGLWSHLRGGEVQRRLAHRVALAVPLLVALAVNLGVAPFLFLQVLYGQFIYTSSILMGMGWIMVIPMLLVAYRLVYIYDFSFDGLGRFGVVVGGVAAFLLLVIGALFSHNMLLMGLPEHFSAWFSHPDGSLSIVAENSYLFRYLHMMLGAVAVGGLAVALLGRFRQERDLELADYGVQVGLNVFFWVTAINIVIGVLYLLTLPRGQMLLFMGRDMGATIAFALGLLLTVGVMFTAWKRRLGLTIAHAIPLVFVMVFLRSWLRSGYLREYFTLDQLVVVEQVSPMILFFVTFVFGLACLAWLWKVTAAGLARS